MTAKWGMCACLALLLALSAGCRTTQPNLKPAKEAEVLNSPPNLTKYATTGLPEQAFDKQIDPASKTFDPQKSGAGGGGRGGGGGGMGGAGSMMGNGR